MQPDQFQALGQVLHSLIDHATNLLAIVSGVRENMLSRIHRGILSEAAADRLDWTRPVEIRRVNRIEARQILEERLHEFLAAYTDVSEIHDAVQTDSLFPLGTKWFNSTETQAVEVRPRDALTWGNDRWKEIKETIQHSSAEEWLANWEKTKLTDELPLLTESDIRAAIDKMVTEKLEESLNRTRLQRWNLRADAEELINMAHKLLEQCLDRAEYQYTIKAVSLGGRQAVNLEVQEQVDARTVRNAVQFVVTRSKVSAASQLRKLKEWPDTDRRILVTDEEREPLVLGEVGQKLLKQLHELGENVFTRITLDFEQYARLEAMTSVLAQASDGDLEIVLRGCSQPVTFADVVDSYHRNHRYRNIPLLRVFLTDEPVIQNIVKRYPRAKFREYVIKKTNQTMGTGLKQLKRDFDADFPEIRKDAPDLVPAEQVIKEMVEQRRIKATPWNDDVSVSAESRL